jgi:riboflavin biosynthesis pyrimidine reductase
MAPSVDGRIVTRRWGALRELTAEYERTAASFHADAWMIGRISMEPYAGRARLPARAPRGRVPPGDFVARTDAPSYAVALDPSGKLRFESASIDEEHVIVVLGDSVPDRHRAFLRAKGVSYLLGGGRIDLRAVLRTLRARFGIRRLLLEGGGKINGSFLAAGLVDELSVLVAPVADGEVGTPTLFDAGETPGPARRLSLLAVERRPGHLVWLRYAVSPGARTPPSRGRRRRPSRPPRR